MVEDTQGMEIDLKVFNDRGRELTVHKVPAIKIDHEVWVKPEVVVKTRLDEIAFSHGIKPRESMLLLLMYAPLGNFQGGFVFRKYNLNKMLFYQWKELEKIGLGNSFEKYTFKADKRGPVPAELRDDLENLVQKKLIEKTGGQNSTLHAKLTPVGEGLAKKVWNEFDMEYQEISKKVKDKILPLDPGHLKEIVHSEYPEYKVKYTELDSE